MRPFFAQIFLLLMKKAKPRNFFLKIAKRETSREQREQRERGQKETKTRNFKGTKGTRREK